MRVAGGLDALSATHVRRRIGRDRLAPHVRTARSSAMPRTPGARRRADIPDTVRAALDAGMRETATLVEGLAIDFAALMAATLPELGREAPAALRASADAGVTRRMALAGTLVHDGLGLDGATRLVTHASDTVRGWSAYAIAAAPDLPLAERLARVRPLADDPHFGVREWAWLALRPHLAASIDEAIALLVPWTSEPSERLRRFAVEATRPRGVWSAHITALVREPACGLPLLEPLVSDPSRYVQDSVANWLNDAARSQPEWVRTTCAHWRTMSTTPATARIVIRAMRSIA